MSKMPQTYLLLTLESDEMTMVEGVTKPMIELSVEFLLTSNQVTNEQTQHTGQALARLTAKKLALAEDTILLRGAQAALPKKVTVRHKDSAGGGLLGAGTDEDRERKKPLTLRLGTQNNVGEEIFKAVTQGIAELTRKGQPGPSYQWHSVHEDKQNPWGARFFDSPGLADTGGTRYMTKVLTYYNAAVEVFNDRVMPVVPPPLVRIGTS